MEALQKVSYCFLNEQYMSKWGKKHSQTLKSQKEAVSDYSPHTIIKPLNPSDSLVTDEQETLRENVCKIWQEKLAQKKPQTF